MAASPTTLSPRRRPLRLATQNNVMPNLRNIFDTVFNVAPDVYICDFVGDAGESHIGSYLRQS